MKLKYKIWLDNEGKVFGEGPYQLLCGVKSSGSLARAAEAMNMSYSRAHGLMKSLSKKLGFALIESHAGGSGGGSTCVTAQAEELIRRYEAFMRESEQALAEIFARHFGTRSTEEAEPETSPEPAQPAPSTAEEQPQPAEPYEPPVRLQPLYLGKRDVVALTGGGGKTSIMYALAEELAANGAKVLLTTTTRIMLPSHGTVHRLIVADETGLMEQLRQGMAPKEIVALGSGLHDGKLMGLDPKFVDKLAHRDFADCILVEADGAAGLPFKAPAAHEPVIPQSATVVLNITGLDALGLPLTDENFHRAEHIAALSGLEIGQPLDVGSLARVMVSREGGRKGVPRGAHWLPVINKIDSEADIPQAKIIARALVEAGADEVVFASTLHKKLKVVLWSKHAR